MPHSRWKDQHWLLETLNFGDVSDVAECSGKFVFRCPVANIAAAASPPIS